MGLTGCYDDLHDLIATHNPDVVALTETKLTKQWENKTSYLRHILHNHVVFMGSHTQGQNHGERGGAAGVLLAVRKDKVVEHVHEVPTALRPYVKLVDIALTKGSAKLTRTDKTRSPRG